MGKDYYDILGVSKDADEAELKKGRFGHAFALQQNPRLQVHILQAQVAESLHLVVLIAAYRKLAMKWHPVSHQYKFCYCASTDCLSLLAYIAAHDALHVSITCCSENLV